MSRWWTAAAVLSAPVILGLGATPAAAQSQYTISIIMTTLGTDGSMSTSTLDLPPGSSVTVKTGMGDPNCPVPDTSTSVPPVTSDANSNSNTAGGSGGGGGGGGSNESNPGVPSGATGNPTLDEPAVPMPPDELPDPDTTTTEDPTTEPDTPTPPPVMPPDVPSTEDPDMPDVPMPDDTDVPTSPPNSAETPEPATLTLGLLGALGAAGYARRKRRQ